MNDAYDVAIIGGGPAGMMAAGAAAQSGARVVLLEKNDSLGKKLLITGGGRCNVTNNEPDNKKLLSKFGDAGKYLASPFSQWNVESTLRFFRDLGVETTEEAEKRVFPSTHKAQTIHDALIRYMERGSVTVQTRAAVREIRASNASIECLVLKGRKTVSACAFILATGGVSRPETGSTGDGFRFLKELGHTVSDTRGALVPLALKHEWTARLAGVSLSHVKITAIQNGAIQNVITGKMLFTHTGLSGPAVLNMSRDIGELLKYGDVELSIDFFPDEGPEKIHARLHEMLRAEHNRMIKNSLSGMIPPALVPVVLERAHVVPETFGHSVRREERIRLLHTLKDFRVAVKELLGLHKAVITSGGVSLDEIDFKTMRSLKYDNLFIVGDLLDINRPSGGYSLQICWTTGAVAGRAAARAHA